MTDKDIINVAFEVFEQEIFELSRAKSFINDDFAKAVRLIASAHKVILSGVGKSGIIARKIAATFSSIGTSSVFLHPVEALHGDIGLVQSGDVAILLSKSGNTEELIRLIPYLKMRSAYIISISGNLNSYLSRHSDIALNGSVEKEACPFNLAPTTSTTNALVIGDALAVASMKLRNVSLEDFSKLHPLGQIGRTITLKVKDVMHSGDSLPIVGPNADFRAALIEMSRKPLGCVCVCDESNTLLGIVTDGDVRRILNKYDNIKELALADLMTKSPISIDADSLLLSALATMENRSSQINVLPVVEDKRLIGLIRIHDIVKSGS